MAAAAAIFLVFTVVRRSSLSDSKLATATTAPSKSEVSDSAVGDHPDDARSVALAVTTTTVAGETTVVPAMTASDLGPTSNAAGGAPISKKQAIVYLGSFANSDNAAAAALRQIPFGATTTALSSTTTSNSASSTSAATSTAILATVTGIQCSYSGAFGPSGLVETFAATIAQRQVAVFVVRDIDPPLVTIVDADTCQPLP